MLIPPVRASLLQNVQDAVSGAGENIKGTARDIQDKAKDAVDTVTGKVRSLSF